MDPADGRHRAGDPGHRHGHLARLRPAAGERHPHRPVLRRPVATSPGYCPTGEDSLYAYIVEDAQDRCGLTPRGAAGHHDGAGGGLPRAVGRDPRDARPTRAGSTTPGSRPTCCPRRGTAAGSCSSATPRTPARPPSPRAAPRPWRTPPCSPSCCVGRDALDQDLWDAFTRPPLRARQGRRRRLQPARPVAARPRAGRRARPDAPHRRRSSASPPEPEENAMTQRLITHLRHVDLAVPDYAKQLDFYTDTWGLTAEHTDTGLTFLAAEGSPGAVRRPAAPGRGQADRPDRVRRRHRRRRRHPRRPAGRRRRPAGQRAGRAADPRRRLRLPVLRQRGPHRRDQRRRRGPAAPPIEEGESIPVRLSHVVINSADPEGTRAFYEKHLAFALSDTLMHPRMGEMMWFMRINALAPQPGHRPRPAPVAAPRVVRDARHRRVHARHRPAAARRRREDLGPGPAPGRQQHLQLLPRPARQHHRVHHRAGDRSTRTPGTRTSTTSPSPRSPTSGARRTR